MNFKEYINNLPVQSDSGINDFIQIVKSSEDFPNTSDPIKLCNFLYLKLDENQTTSFQKIFIFFEQFEKSNDIPKKYKNTHN